MRRSCEPGEAAVDAFTGGTGRNRLSGSLDWFFFEMRSGEQIPGSGSDLMVEDLAQDSKKAAPGAAGAAVQVLQSDGRRADAWVLEWVGDAARVVYSDPAAPVMVELVQRGRVFFREISPSPEIPPPRAPQRSQRSKPRLAVWGPQGSLSV